MLISIFIKKNIHILMFFLIRINVIFFNIKIYTLNSYLFLTSTLPFKTMGNNLNAKKYLFRKMIG